MLSTEEIGLEMTADELVGALLSLSATAKVAILDSCGVGHLASHLLIAGIDPIESRELNSEDASNTLRELQNAVSSEFPCIFTLSYDFGLKLAGIPSRHSATSEPDIYIARFAAIIVHDYDSGRTTLTGDASRFTDIRKQLETQISDLEIKISEPPLGLVSDHSKAEYLSAVENIQELIRSGDTYQTNLTQQFTASLPANTTPESIFWRLRRDHPAPFAAYINRTDSTVISASPERFFRIGRERDSTPIISTSPIKGTRTRGRDAAEDTRLRSELLASAKDRAENTMIVDLLRNDLGRVCEYGSVRVEKLCDIEEHPTLFHLVSTVAGELRSDARFADVITALFPCGSITGAPKISTMRIIDATEPSTRGLSMGAIGYAMPGGDIDLSVAIRTMVVRDRTATFNVGGGIVIDSDPEAEYAESLLKAKALLNALGVQG